MADPLARLVWERAHGNPLYIEQVVDHLAAAELVEVRDGTAALVAGAAGAVDSAVPDTIRGLIVSRLDRLPPAHQLTAKVSSVIGPLFPARALAGVYPDPAAVPALREHIRALVRERLIREDRPEPDPDGQTPEYGAHGRGSARRPACLRRGR